MDNRPYYRSVHLGGSLVMESRRLRSVGMEPYPPGSLGSWKFLKLGSTSLGRSASGGHWR